MGFIVVDRVSTSIERCLSAVAETRCANVSAHQDAVGILCGALSRVMNFESGYVTKLQYAARLHDIGKVMLSDDILNKSGPLDATEWDIIRQHPKLGFNILSRFDDPLIRLAALVALCHHERWDGSGYPDGLAGEEIPPEARIVAVCDVYHALREVRPYRSPIGHEQAVSIILDGDGRTLPSHFDPIVHAAFKGHNDLLRDAFEEFAACGDRSQELGTGPLKKVG
jgi:putative two-component system response regulator